MTELEKIAKVMKNYREKRGIHPKEISDKLGLTVNAFYNYESGKQKIQLVLWIKWCQAIGIKVRSAAEYIEEKLSGTKRSRLSKKEQELRKARDLLRKQEENND